MKVIKPGRQQTGWAAECVCTGEGNGGGGCGATLLVDSADLFQTSRTDMGGDTDYFTTFRCCACGVETDIKDYPVHSSLPTKQQWLAEHPKAQPPPEPGFHTRYMAPMPRKP